MLMQVKLTDRGIIIDKVPAQNYKNILIIKMSSLGDVIHALPFSAVLRKLYPQAKISWLVHPQFSGFLPDPPTINQVIYFDKVAFNKMGLWQKINFLRKFRQELHAEKFDLVIDLQGLFKSAVVASLTGCSNRIGYCEMREGSGLVSKAICGSHSEEHVIERYLDVVRYLGAEVKNIEFPLPDLRKEERSIQKKLEHKGFKEEDYVVFVPGARWQTKEWPPSHYAELADKIADNGSFVILAGGPDEKEKASLIMAKAHTDKLIDLTGQTSLRELAALIKKCSVFISGDTGPLHFAAALKKPLIAMYGPTKADRTGPYGSDKATVLITPAECAGCLKKHCSDWHCMEDITPELVYQEYLKKLGSK
ncbi:MAG: lipopolysaccharide heptosyltransferase I [Acidaminococcaceae bacterium]